MSTLTDIARLQREVADSKAEDQANLKLKIASLSNVHVDELLHLKEHWSQEVKRNRSLDQETMARRHDAELWLKAIAFALSNPGLRPPQAQGAIDAQAPGRTGVLFKTFSDDYLAYVKNTFALKTHENAQRVMNFFAEQFGEKDLGEFTLEDLEKYKAKRVHGGVSRTTVNIDIRTIKAAFHVAVDWKRIQENPFDRAKQLKVDQAPKRILTENEFAKVLGAIKEDWLHDIIAFNILTGLRLGEIMNLRWADIDLSKPEIIIRSSTQYRVKGGKMRPIPLGPDALAILKSRQKSSDWVFVGAKGKKYTDDYVSKKFKAYVRAAGLPDEIHYHRLRDTYLTWLAEANVPIHIIKQIAGHSSLMVTEGYLSASSEAMKAGVEKIRLPSPDHESKKPATDRDGELDSESSNS